MTIMNIHGINYEKIDTYEKMTVPDCFVVSKNTIGKGHGEGKFYIKKGDAKKYNLREFFGNEGFNINCFILKKDLLKYMEDCEAEYLNPEQPYCAKDEMPRLWSERIEKIKQLDDIIYFNLFEQTQISGSRIYVSSDKENSKKFKYIGYQILREVSLPKVTYLSSIKLKNPKDDKIIYYFRLFVDYFGEEENSKEIEKEVEKIESLSVEVEEKLQLTRARIGQGKYRAGVLALCPFCPITLVSDDRLLIASHIKPWAKANEEEKIDPKNGFMFTPTIDFLFDRGFITFTNDKKMIISPWLSKMTCSKLNIVPDKKYDFLPTDGREQYLDYHRGNIFKS